MNKISILSDYNLELLHNLMQKKYLTDFILFGGTALALQYKHRPAKDLHFFTNKDFDTTLIKKYLIGDFPNIEITEENTNLLSTKIENSLINFRKYKYKFEYPIYEKENIRLANIKDIAAMKIDAIVSRGKKKDFYDLYFILEKFSINELLNIYKNKYHHQSIHHVIISLSYFDDAENNPEPTIFNQSLTWDEVKSVISNKLKTYTA